MSTSKEVNEYYQRAFKLLTKGLDLTKEHVEIFKKVRGFLDDAWVGQIDSFKPGNKGIMLIGGDYDLLRGIVSYIWYKHRLIYPVSGNNSIRSEFVYGNFAGKIEDEVRKDLFSENWLPNHMHGRVLFLRNIKTEYIYILERVAAILEEMDDSPIIYEHKVGMIHHGLSVEDGIYDLDDPRIQRRKEWPKFKLLPSILVMNIKQTEGLSVEFLQRFSIIKLGPGEKGITLSDGKEIVNAILPGTKKALDTPKLKLVANKGEVYWCGFPLSTIKGKDFDILYELARTPGILVKNDNLHELIDSDSHKGVLLNQRISKIRNSFPSPYNDLTHPLCIIPDAKQNKGYYCLNLTEKQVEAS